MGETHHQATTSSRLGIRSTGSGDIVEVRGHIVRSTGRKDRHSKVCTAKGPRDRRVRLAAHTAIQFYDVQDRLGYDRPSKAVDWLIKKAKSAIDELDELPPWNPTSTTGVATTTVPTTSVTMETAQNASTHHLFAAVDTAIASGSRRTATMVGGSAEFQNPNNSSNFLPASLDSDSIADTIKSFFPMGAAAAEAPSSTIQFHQNYPPDLLSRTSSQNQDLRLSLHSFPDPILLHHHQTHQTHQNEQTLFGFDGSSAAWSEHHQQQQQQHQQQHQQHQQQAELNRFQRMVAWNNAGADTGNGGGAHGGSAGGFIFNSVPISQTSLSPSPPPLQPLLFGQSQSQFFSSQRGPLQSSNTPSIRAWMDQQTIPDHQISQPSIHHHHSSSISGMGFASGGLSSFHIPARIQGEEEHDGISDKPSSASSNSRH